MPKAFAAGATFVCVASGPSLTVQDVQKVHEWRKKDDGTEKRVIAVNSSYTVCSFADIVFAMDLIYWQKMVGKVSDFCQGAILATTCSQRIEGVRFFPSINAGNSGAGAIGLASYLGAKRVILIGYDCQYAENGKRHFFGNHPPGLNGNAGSLPAWPEQFAKLARRLKRVEVLNATRQTALTLWPKVALEDCLT